jgi:predicted nucleic-acid-binding Zn-ribbon protein
MRRRAGDRLTAGGRRTDDGLVGLGLFAREWERTCSECGYTWRVPRSIARRGIRGMSAMTVRGATATPGPMNDTSNLGALSADIEARAELMEGFRVCAKCGADNFTQRPCRRSETATTDLPPPKP